MRVSISRALPILPLVLLTAAMANGPAGAQNDNEILPGIHRLAGIDESLPDGDLEPLKEILKKAEVVGLGEAVHTTEGFSRAKFRVFKYMVEEMGFRAFGFESPWIGADLVADYVATCQGSARQAVRGLFGVWNNASVVDLVTWMCEWNRVHPDDPVYFYGFDHQQSAGDASALGQTLEILGFGLTDDLRVDLQTCGRVRARGRLEHDRCMDLYDEIEEILDRRGDEIDEEASLETLEFAYIHLVGLRAHEEQNFYAGSDPSRAFEGRDRGMAYIAENIRRLRFPGAKTALWAHNAHIARGRTLNLRGTTRVMGSFLKKSLRRKYKTLGLIAFEAETDWPNVGCGPWAVASPDSVEGRLRELGEPFLLVDLRFPGAETPFLERGRHRINWSWEIVPRSQFNGLLYMDFAARMRPTAWDPCS